MNKVSAEGKKTGREGAMVWSDADAKAVRTSSLTPMTFPPSLKAQQMAYIGQVMANSVEAARKARPNPWPRRREERRPDAKT